MQEYNGASECSFSDICESYCAMDTLCNELFKCCKQHNKYKKQEAELIKRYEQSREVDREYELNDIGLVARLKT